MFNNELIDRLFAEDKDLMTVSPDSKWVIYKFDRGAKFEIRIEQNLDTLYRFYLEKNETVRDRLIDFIKSVNLWGEDK